MEKRSFKVAIIAIALALCTSCAAIGDLQEPDDRLHPVILVPGTAGSQLEARLTAEYEPTSEVCNRGYPSQKDGEGWFRLWLDAGIILRGDRLTRCFNDRMTLTYDPVLDNYRNAAGVETRVPHFGSTEAMQYLNPQFRGMTNYMAPLVTSLEQIGYVEGKTLFGAPYDFRYGLAPEGHPPHVGSQFLQDLKNLIEEASNSNGGKPVILLAHSLGGLFALQLLNRNPLSWRKKYIKHVLTLSVPWGGTLYAMLTFASGYALEMPLINPLSVRSSERTFESNLWLMPNPKTYGPTKPLVVTPNMTYTAYDIEGFFHGIGYPEAIYPYNSRIVPLIEQLIAPHVPVTNLMGTNIPTPETMVYGEDSFDLQPTFVYGDGDGTVSVESMLTIESEWAGQKNQVLKCIRVPGVAHTAMVQDEASLREIKAEIEAINSDITSPLVSSA